MKRIDFALLLAGLAVVTAPAKAENANLNKATNTVNNIRQADPPRASMGTVSGSDRDTDQQLPPAGSQYRSDHASTAAAVSAKKIGRPRDPGALTSTVGFYRFCCNKTSIC